MKNRIMKNRIEASWGHGDTTLFLDAREGAVLLDYEWDTEFLHKICGGKNYYESRSGCSGAGYLEGLGALTPVGYYRVDTSTPWWNFVSVGHTPQGHQILVAVPYASHKKDKSDILRDNPVIIKIGEEEVKLVIYCEFYRNFLEILKNLLKGTPLPEELVLDGVTYPNRGHKLEKRIFSRFFPGWGGPREEEISIEYYNLCSMELYLPPLDFFGHKLKGVYVDRRERLFQLLSIEKLGETFVRTVAGGAYRGRALPGNPLEMGDLTAGWRRVADDILVRFYDRSNEAHLVAYVEAASEYRKVAQRLAARLGEGEEFISFVSSAHDGRQYVEFELKVPKILFQLERDRLLAEVRKGLARKVREDVMRRTRQWVDEVSDQSLLESIPDDMVVTFDDSLDAGNCIPGTESFRDQYFPGKTQTTAGELKKFADNYNVMRVFRYLAVVGRFKAPKKAE